MKKKISISNTIQIMKRNWKRMGLIFTFDLLFILLLVNLRFVLVNINGQLIVLSYGLSGAVRIVSAIVLVIVESLLLLAIYAFFKYLIVCNLKEIFTKKELGFNRISSFISLNWIVSIPFLIIYLVLIVLIMNHIGGVVDGGIANIVVLYSLLFKLIISGIVIVALSVYFYTLLSLAHYLFLREKSLIMVLKRSVIESFKFRFYKTYLGDIKILFVSLIVLLVFYLFMKLFVLTNIQAYLVYGGIYNTGLTAIILLSGYCLLLFNRINLYLMVNND